MTVTTKSCVYRGAQVDHSDGQERVPSGQSGYGDPADAPKQEEHKLNLRLTGFKAKEGKIEKELMQRLNTKLLQGQMRLHVKVIVATWQWPTTLRAFASTTAGTRPGTVLLKFVMNEDR